MTVPFDGSSGTEKKLPIKIDCGGCERARLSFFFLVAGCCSTVPASILALVRSGTTDRFHMLFHCYSSNVVSTYIRC